MIILPFNTIVYARSGDAVKEAAAHNTAHSPLILLELCKPK